MTGKSTAGPRSEKPPSHSVTPELLQLPTPVSEPFFLTGNTGFHKKRAVQTSRALPRSPLVSLMTDHGAMPFGFN